MKRGAGSTEVRERSEEGFVGLAGALELGPIASDRIKHFIKNLCSWEAALLPGFLCFILDTSWVKWKEITIEILFFPSSEKIFLCLRALPFVTVWTVPCLLWFPLWC
jgi:hypothetical protein